MDGIVEDKDALFHEILKHLDQIQDQSETTQLDEELLRRGERALDAHVSQQMLWRILNTGETLLQSIQQDPKPLTRLLERTVHLIPFDDLKQAISTEKLIEGLRSVSIPVQLLCLAYLRKASDTPSGASFVACSTELTQTLITVWLASESTEVSERALEDIVALLAVDSPSTVTIVTRPNDTGRIDEAEGSGLMWRRVFQDAEVYQLLFAWTSLVKSIHFLESKKGQHAVTISQARLFDFISRVAQLDWAAITTSTLSNTELEYTRQQSGSQQQGQQQAFGGILRYAANGMIDPEDYLMEILRRDFFLKLLQVVEEARPNGVSSRAMKAIQDAAGVETISDGMNGTNGTNGVDGMNGSNGSNGTSGSLPYRSS